VTGCRLSGRQPFSRLAPAQNFVAESHQTAMNSIAIIIRWNGLPEPLLQRCLSSILWQLSPADAVFLVAGGSPNETPIPLLAHVTVVRTAAAISQASVITVTPDVVLAPFVLSELRGSTDGSDGVVGAGSARCGYSNPAGRLTSSLGGTSCASQFIHSRGAFSDPGSMKRTSLQTLDQADANIRGRERRAAASSGTVPQSIG
jgi:hypothetical protein